MQYKKNKNKGTPINEYADYAFLEDYLRIDLDRVKAVFLLEYPFVDVDIVNNIVTDISKKINIEYIKTFVNNIIEVYPYFLRYKDSILKKYYRDIFTIIKENCTINVVDNKNTYNLYTYDGKDYFIDRNGDLYDEDNIYVGYVIEGNTVIFTQLLDNRSIIS